MPTETKETIHNSYVTAMNQHLALSVESDRTQKYVYTVHAVAYQKAPVRLQQYLNIKNQTHSLSYSVATIELCLSTAQ